MQFTGTHAVAFGLSDKAKDFLFQITWRWRVVAHPAALPARSQAP